MILLLVYFLVLVFFVLVFTREVIAPASGNSDKRWQILSAGVNFLHLLATLGAGVVFAPWFQQHALTHIFDHWHPVALGGLIFLVASFFSYWWHRAQHASPFLWRATHQLHHSPKRIESLTACYAHPLDGLSANLLNTGIAYFLFGAPIEAAAIAIGFAAVYVIYIHSDTKSPRWLGWLLQRPEMHRVHHQTGTHAGNYSLPVWDLIFGTHVNPVARVENCGFSEDKAGRIQDMLLMRDVKG
jgi:sterol desaturase/sphingolipid hydroxylase (fatty acid hydroxylase superfamily)